MKWCKLRYIIAMTGVRNSYPQQIAQHLVSVQLMEEPQEATRGLMSRGRVISYNPKEPEIIVPEKRKLRLPK